MGHYDQDFEAQQNKEIEWDKLRAKKQLQLMEEFRTTLSIAGTRGISPRHLDALQDLINETKLRAL